MRDGQSRRRRALKRGLRRGVAALTTLTGIASVWYWLFARRAIRVLTYHGIENDSDSYFSVSKDNFERQIALVAKKYSVISIDDLHESIARGQSLARDSVVLTFDDGYDNFRTHALPILEKYRVPATCFVIAATLDRHDPRFLGKEDVRRLAGTERITIGSHSCWHRSIRQVSAEIQEQEVAGSKRQLEQALGAPVHYFCYPYGTRNDVDGTAVEAVKRAGYRLAMTSINGVNTHATDPFRLRRTKIEAGDDLTTFARILRGALDVWFFVDLLLFPLQGRRREPLRLDDEPARDSTGNGHQALTT